MIQPFQPKTSMDILDKRFTESCRQALEVAFPTQVVGEELSFHGSLPNLNYKRTAGSNLIWLNYPKNHVKMSIFFTYII